MAPLLTVSKVIGSNSFGVISEGQYLGVPVVIHKIFSDCAGGNELPAIRKLEHDNVQKILYFQDLTDQKCVCRWVVFAVTDATLDDYFHSRFEKLPHPMPDHLEALTHLSRGLEFIDSKKLVHGAIKPSNILISVSYDDRVTLKISQNGLLILPRAKMALKNAFGFDSLSYMSPEWLRVMELDSDQLAFNMAADVFSLGCIFYGYVTKGKHPFGCGVAMLNNIVEGRNQLAGITNHPAVELIRLMIENDAKSRPSTGEVSSKVAALQRKVVTPQPVKVAAQRSASDHDHYVNEFRVNPCRKANCNDKFCFNYHQPNQRRRRSFRKKDGTLNYSGVTVCRLYNKETGKCPNGDNCPNLHENVGHTERSFHLSNYKVELCSRKNCTFPHCSFAHGEADLRTPIYGHADKIAITGSNRSAKHTGTKHDKILLSYKTEQCPFPYDQCPDKGSCFKYHVFKTRTTTNSVVISSLDKRRCLTKYAYWSRRCPMIYDPEDDQWKDPVLCPTGDACRYCHTNVEHQYHVLIYKTEDCSFWKKGDCKRGQLCAFAHNDKRKPDQFQENESNLEKLKRYLRLL